MGLFNGLTWWVIYFAPSLVAWYRVKQGGRIIGSLGSIVILNAILGTYQEFQAEKSLEALSAMQYSGSIRMGETTSIVRSPAVEIEEL